MLFASQILSLTDSTNAILKLLFRWCVGGGWDHTHTFLWICERNHKVGGKVAGGGSGGGLSPSELAPDPLVVESELRECGS